MKFVKTRLRRKIDDEFLPNSLITYIKNDIVKLFDNDSIIDIFDLKKKQKVWLRMLSFNRS